MILVLKVFLVVAPAVLAYFVGKWRASLPSRLLKSEVRRLEAELRIRQLWAVNRRHELSRLLRIYAADYPSGGRRKVLELELVTQATGCGLNVDGSTAKGFAETRELSTSEYLELGELVSRP